MTMTLQDLCNSRQGQDIVILGGGPSVNDIPLSLLRHWFVIGTNKAYMLGDELIDILFFGDLKFWHENKEALAHYKGDVYTNHHGLEFEPKAHWLPRKNSGFHRDAIGWNGNTGAAAINLALIMGARNVYLLGFDMKVEPCKDHNWYASDGRNATAIHYEKWRDKLSLCEWRKTFPATDGIFNLNPDSALDCFTKKPWQMVLIRDESDAMLVANTKPSHTPEKAPRGLFDMVKAVSHGI